MKKYLIFILMAVSAFGADAANDLILSQRKSDNSGNIQRNVAPVTNGFLTFNSSKVPTSPDLTYSSPTLTFPASGVITGAGSLALTAGGSNQNITLTPSGTGINILSSSLGGLPAGLTSAETSTSIAGMASISKIGGGPQLTGYRMNTSFAAPSAVTSGQGLLYLLGGGYKATGFTTISQGGAALSFNATEAWTDSATGGQIRFQTTPNGTTSPTTVATIDHDGKFYFGSTTPGYISGASGALSLVAQGTDQTITLTPSGTGLVRAGRLSTATVPSGTMLHLVGTDTNSVFQTFDAIDGSAVTLLRRINGTLASPSATLSGETIGIVGFAGYGGGYVTATRSSMIGTAAENWTGSAQGAGLAFRTTPTGSTTTAIRMLIDAGGAVQIPSTNTAGLQIHNQTDQVTNYERLSQFWSSNQFKIETQAGGTGTVRNLQLSAGATATLTMRPTGSSSGIVDIFTPSTNAAGAIGFRVTGNSNTATSGSSSYAAILPVYNQASGTAANDDLSVIRTETAVGSGVQRLLNLGTTALGSQFAVNNRGGLSVSYQSLSGAGAVNVTNYSTEYTSTGAAQALTLADGTAGQIKVIVHGVDGGSGVLTPATKTGFSTITFTNAGDSVTLQFFTTRGWIVIGSYGVTIAP